MANPVIFHVDVNSAFLSWEAWERKAADPNAPDLREIPSAVGGDRQRRHGIILAKSTPAKAYHIRTGEPIVKALEKCPTLTIVPPNFSAYVKHSRELISLLETYAPSVEQYSIDEAFCDMTGTRALYGDPVAFAHKLKDEIRDTLGFTVNIGVSTNRLLAKMASDFEKPDRVHTLFPDEISEKMWPLPVEELLFVGKSTSRKLREMCITTIGQLGADRSENPGLPLQKARGYDLEIRQRHRRVRPDDQTRPAQRLRQFGNPLPGCDRLPGGKADSSLPLRDGWRQASRG